MDRQAEGVVADRADFNEPVDQDGVHRSRDLVLKGVDHLGDLWDGLLEDIFSLKTKAGKGERQREVKREGENNRTSMEDLYCMMDQA
jgi:hypothetical protein